MTKTRPHVQWWFVDLPESMPKAIINPLLPVRTRDGRAAFIREYDAREKFPILASINRPENNPRRFAVDGSFYTDANHPSDLFNVGLRAFVIQRDIFQKRLG